MADRVHIAFSSAGRSRNSIPCYECADRHIGCHSECDRYGSYKLESGRLHAKYLQSREKERIVDRFVFRNR